MDDFCRRVQNIFQRQILRCISQESIAISVLYPTIPRMRGVRGAFLCTFFLLHILERCGFFSLLFSRFNCLQIPLPKRKRAVLRGSIRKQSRKILSAKRHLPRYRALPSTKEGCSPLPCICRLATILRCFAVLAEPLFSYVTRAFRRKKFLPASRRVLVSCALQKSAAALPQSAHSCRCFSSLRRRRASIRAFWCSHFSSVSGRVASRQRAKLQCKPSRRDSLNRKNQGPCLGHPASV